MQYLGGKTKIAKALCAYLESRRGGRLFLEPFCGGLSVTSTMKGNRIASDVLPCLITLYKACQDGWIPPKNVTEEEYQTLKKNQDPTNPMTAFAGFGCSFGGKYFRGYARSGSQNYASNAANSLARSTKACRDVVFLCNSYECYSPDSSVLVYCDPPYTKTEGYSMGEFNHTRFWQTVREWSQAGAIVLVSEYEAPEDFKCVWSIETRTTLKGKDNKWIPRTERLFEYCP
jgi:DNA adenine methylase